MWLRCKIRTLALSETRQVYVIRRRGSGSRLLRLDGPSSVSSLPPAPASLEGLTTVNLAALEAVSRPGLRPVVNNPSVPAIGT